MLGFVVAGRHKSFEADKETIKAVRLEFVFDKEKLTGRSLFVFLPMWHVFAPFRNAHVLRTLRTLRARHDYRNLRTVLRALDATNITFVLFVRLGVYQIQQSVPAEVPLAGVEDEKKNS